MNSNWSYSPETFDWGPNRWFSAPCDLEIWRMTLKNNRAPLLCYFKLCASFKSHQWIQTEVTIARRHGHVFRMALHNEGDWRMETWQRARQGEFACLHTPIPELCNAILNTCKMLSRFYIIPSNVNKSQTYLSKPFIARDLIGGPYMQAKHADVCSGVLFWTACMRRPHVLSLPSRCEKSDSWRQARSVKTAKKSWTVPQSGHVTLNCVQMASKCWVFIAHFSIYSTSRCRCHAGTDIPRHCGHTLQISQVVRTVRHRISCCATTIHVMRECKIGKSSPMKTLVIPKSWSFRCVEWQER